MGLWVIGSASKKRRNQAERLRGRCSVKLPSVTGNRIFVVSSRIHVIRSCKDLFYNRQIKTTYFPGLDIYSGDAERRSKTARSLLTKQPSKSKKVDKSKGTKKSRPKQYWQAAVKRSKESSQGSDKAKALSNGGVCQPPTAPRKSGEIV